MWRPWNFRKSRGEHNRTFTDAEETEICDIINTRYIKMGRPFTYSEAYLVVTTFHREKQAREQEARAAEGSEDCNGAPEFKCSARFITQFMHRHGYVVRRARLHRRPAVKSEEEARWMEEIDSVLSDPNVDRRRVLNADETCWRFWPQGLSTWAKIGTKEVKLIIDGNDKENFTTICTVTADGTKLPMTLIAKGKTDACEAGFGDIGEHNSDHSESGWSTCPVFIEYLRKIRDYFDDHDPIWLMLDSYSVHRSPEVREYARSLGIILLFVPPGMTDALQPLDRSIFGAMKQEARRLWREYVSSL
jgi:hypothetical protein